MKKFIILVLMLFLVLKLTGCNNKNGFTSNLNSETGWTVLNGTYVKTESAHDVLVFEMENGEEMYIFMTFADECDVPEKLQTGDRLGIKIVIVEKTDEVDTARVFEIVKYNEAPVSVDAEVISKIETLSQKLANVTITEK